MESTRSLLFSLSLSLLAQVVLVLVSALVLPNVHVRAWIKHVEDVDLSQDHCCLIWDYSSCRRHWHLVSLATSEKESAGRLVFCASRC